MTFRKLTAIVLRVNDLGESDKIVTFYTKELGKLAGIAKGAKKSKKRFSNTLEIFSLLQVLCDYRSRSSLCRIDEAELQTSFINLRQNYDNYVSAVLACESVYYWTKEYDADKNIFNLLLWTLQSIDKGSSPRVTQIFFQVKLYTLLGYELHLAGCIKCKNSDKLKAPYTFHPARHGLLCKRCSPEALSRDTFPLSLNTIKLLQHAQDLPLGKLARLRFSDNSVREALLLFKVYGHYLLQREIAAWNFME